MRNYEGNNIYQLFPDKKDKYGVGEATYHPSVKVYYIPKYEPVEGIVCVGITLKYFNDSLYYINTDNPRKLEDAFELKYGKPKIELKEEDKYYTNGYGTKITKTDRKCTSTYETGNSKISCYSYLSIFHDEKGKEHSVYSLSIYNDITVGLVYKYDWKIEEQQEKDKLKDFDEL